MYSTTSTFQWQNVTLAFWLRYPNPFASHVLSVDVLDRYVDENGVLKTTRLVLKKGKVPNGSHKNLSIIQKLLLLKNLKSIPKLKP
ncbi:unnamed protein product [Mucor hiemalis]